MKIYDEVKHADTIGIGAHIRPDGDAVGSCLSLYLYLKERMPDTYIKIFLEKPGISFSCVPAIEAVTGDDSADIKFDVFILLDTNRDRLTAGGKKAFDEAGLTINIDHHVSNAEGCADINCIDYKAPACAEIVYKCMEKEYINEDIALLIYMGIAHDTGIFRFSNVTPETMRIAGELLEYGFDASDMISTTFYEKTLAQNRVQARIVLDSKLYFDDTVMVGIADSQLMKEYGVTKSDFDGVVNQLLITQGVDAAVFIYQKAEDCYKISLRAANDRFNVAKVAEALGGGGHVRAAGVDYKGTAAQTIETVLGLLKEQII